MTNEQTKLDYAKELENLNANQEFKDKFPPSLKIGLGETKLKVLSDIIREVSTENGLKKIVTVEVDGQPYSWWINMKNPVWRELLQIGKERGSLEGMQFSIVRIGERKATRYQLKKL